MQPSIPTQPSIPPSRPVPGRMPSRFPIALATLALALTASVASAATHVKDAAGMFSPQAVQQAEAQLAELQSKNGKLVVVETMAEPPADVQRQIVADASKRNDVLFQLASERRQSTNADVYVLVNKTPGNFQLAERRELQSTGLPAAERSKVQDAMLNAFKAQQFDQGLTAGVSMLTTALADAPRGTTANPSTPTAQTGATPAPQPRRDEPVAPPTTPAPEAGHRGLFGGGCCTIVGVGLLIVIVIMVVRRLSNRGGPGGPSMMSGGYPNQPGGVPPQGGYPQQGGYPPQYPQQQQRGGGFGTGIAGGVLGGVLGSVLGNQMSRGHDGGGNSNDAGAVGGGGASQDSGSVGGGGDFDSGGDTGSVGGGGDFGGGDSGGGGDF